MAARSTEVLRDRGVTIVHAVFSTKEKKAIFYSPRTKRPMLKVPLASGLDVTKCLAHLGFDVQLTGDK